MFKSKEGASESYNPFSFCSGYADLGLTTGFFTGLCVLFGLLSFHTILIDICSFYIVGITSVLSKQLIHDTHFSFKKIREVRLG